MPKKFSGNTKALEAKAHKEQQKQADKLHQAKRAEDAKWRDEGDPKAAKAAQRRAEREQKAQEAAERKRENRLLLEQEEAALSKPKRKPDSLAPKVTRAQLERQRMQREKEAKEKAKEKELERQRITQQDDLLVENPNQAMASMVQAEGIVEARSVTDAIAVLSTSEASSAPSNTMTYKKFEAEALPRLKADNPELKHSQLRELVKKEWKKDPRNPANQP